MIDQMWNDAMRGGNWGCPKAPGQGAVKASQRDARRPPTAKRVRGKGTGNLHKVSLEEFFQLPLGCRVSQVSDVQAATFGSAGKDSVVVSRLVVGGLARNRGIGQSVGNVIDGSGGSVCNLLNCGSHFE